MPPAPTSPPTRGPAFDNEVRLERGTGVVALVARGEVLEPEPVDDGKDVPLGGVNQKLPPMGAPNFIWSAKRVRLKLWRASWESRSSGKY